MKYPCYKVKDKKEFDYIRAYLNSFGYNTKILIYFSGCDYIVLNSRGKFGLADNVNDSCINRFNRYETTNINEFLLTAAKLKNTTFKYNNTIIAYPYYRAVNQSDYNYVRASLDSFGYDVSIMSEEYFKDWDCIVLDSDGKFGICNNLTNEEHVREKRTPITDVEIFLKEAEKLLKNEKKQIKEIKMENNKPQTKEPKVGDKVLVKNNRDEYFQVRIYIGKIHNKHACVNAGYESEFNRNKPVVLSFWDEMITELKVSKIQIANKFGVPVNMLEIVD